GPAPAGPSAPFIGEVCKSVTSSADRPSAAPAACASSRPIACCPSSAEVVQTSLRPTARARSAQVSLRAIFSPAIRSVSSSRVMPTRVWDRWFRVGFGPVNMSRVRYPLAMASHRRRRASELMEHLRLQRHPERGFFVESYRSSLVVDGLPPGYDGPRAASTAIYFLLTAEEPTTYLHRLRSDELFHFYEGGPLDVLCLRDGEPPALRRLGLDLARGERPQLAIAAGTWFAAELVPGAAHCLFGCTV